MYYKQHGNCINTSLIGVCWHGYKVVKIIKNTRRSRVFLIFLTTLYPCPANSNQTCIDIVSGMSQNKLLFHNFYLFHSMIVKKINRAEPMYIHSFPRRIDFKPNSHSYFHLLQPNTHLFTTFRQFS